MKQFLLILGVLVLIAVGLVFVARHRRVTVHEPRTSTLRTDDGVLFTIEYRDQRIAVLMPKEWDNETSRTTTNRQTKAFDVDVDFFASGGRPLANIAFHSIAPTTILIDNQTFRLAQGRVFLIKPDPNSTAKKLVNQAPLGPLKPTREYVTRLRKELDKPRTTE